MKKLKRFVLIAVALLAINWLVGAAQINGVVPAWVFLVVNFPAGGVLVWMETAWTGTQYWLFGHTISDGVSLAVFFAVVLIQAYLYFLISCWWLLRKAAQRA